MRTKNSLLYGLTFILVILSTGLVSGERIYLPAGVFYYQPSASVLGLEAAWVNPAAFGSFYPGGFQLMADHRDGAFADSWGAGVCRDRLAVAFRRLDLDDDRYKEFILAGGVPIVGETSLGLSYRYFNDGPGIYNNRHFWNIGFLTRGKGVFGFAALWSNINRGKIGGERTSMEQRYGLSYRPYGPKITLSVDMFLSTQNSIKEADFIYHVEYTPRPGLYVNGFVDSEKNFEFGFRVNLLKYFVGARGGFNEDGDHRGTTAFFGATALKQPSLISETSRRLALSVSGQVQENPPQPVFGRSRTPSAVLIKQLYRAAEDPNIKEAVLDLSDPVMGFGQAQELREALVYFKGKGKQVTCYLVSPRNIAYFIAAAADLIYISPVSQLNLVGLRAELTFYAGTMEKLGIKADLMQIGEYKTAPERFTDTAASEANRRQVNRLLDDTFEQFVAALAEGRRMTGDSIKSIIDNGPFTSEEALRLGLVDGLVYREELSEKYLSGLPEITFYRYLEDTLLNDDWRRPPVLAVVVAEGDITYGGDVISQLQGDKMATPALLNRAFNQVTGDDHVKGIVFRINSPGGYALAGEDIYRAVARAAERKPLLVSMVDVAASGGYYIAMPAKKIFANPATVTGSIGIYGGKVDLSGLYEKLALRKELYTRGRFAGMLSYSRPFSDAEREKYFSHMKAFYDHFLKLVAENRSLPIDSVDHLSQGRVWTGREARQNGLVDELGGLKSALDYMADQLEIDHYNIEIYPVQRPLFVLPGGFLMKAVAGIFTTDASSEKNPEQALGLVEAGEYYTRLPFDITIE
ncbi:MAG: signal peptide peptidase SppA [candidate division Zixibacteria bacterium]|nr:signal peptide peptidase SppA [candidate division Zixibacteria bacterium]